jgi:dGTPase
VDAERAQLKAFLYDHLYYSDTLRPEKGRAEVVVTELFDYYLANPDSLPSAYREAFAREPHRVVCDYIAGMTDNFILHQYGQLLDPAQAAAKQRL